MILKDGSEPEDPRLDWLPEKDEKSRQYKAVQLLSSSEQTPVSRTWTMSTRLNQGREGQCALYSMSHLMISNPKSKRGFIEDNVDVKNWITRRYWEAQKQDAWPGGEYPGANPKYGGTSLLAGIKSLKDIGLVSEYRWAFGEEELYSTIGHLGPAVIGVRWYSNMHSPDAKGVIKPGGSLAGGHAIMVRGLNVRTQMYRLTNSWGRGWGVKGECFLSRTDMDRLLQEDGECLIGVLKTTTPVNFAI